MGRVILETDVHCTDCAKKIRKAVQNYLGVEKVWATPQTGLVVVAGTADAELLRRRIQRKLRRPVDIVSDGVAPEPVGAHWAPQPQYGGWGMPPEPPHPYGAAQQAYQYRYAGKHWSPPMPPRLRHVFHGVPARHDDEEGPEACCSIQ